MAKMTHETLIAELQMHVATVAADAQRGDYDAKQWLLWAFPGHVSFFTRIWNAPPEPPAPAPKQPTRNRPHDRRLRFDKR